MSALPAELKAKFRTRSKYGIVLLIIFSIALALRVWLPYENVFTEDGVRFIGNDPWFYMRLADNLAHNFPHRILFDPYALYPGGSNIGIPPFFLMLLGSTTWVIGLGSPSQHIVETVGAYFPAILGALVTVPVYFIGRELFNRNVGLLSAGLIAILPGQFLLRSLLGFTDQHIAEVLFSTVAALFLIMAIKRAKENETSFSHIRNRDLINLRKPLIYSVLAGVALGIYLLSWIGALLFVFLLFAYMIVQYIIDHLRGKSTDYLCIIGVPIFLLSLIMIIPFSNLSNLGKLGIPSLTIALFALLALSGVSWLMSRRNIKRAYYPLVLGVLGLVGVGVFYAIDPSLLSSMLDRFATVFTPSETALTIGEARSLLSLDGFLLIVTFFGTNYFIALIALGLIIYTGIKQRSLQSTLTFLVIWTMIMLLAMLGQNRFAYYFAVNVALLTGFLCWRVLEWRLSSSRQALPVSSHFRAWQGVTVTAMIVFVIAFAPNILLASQMDYFREPPGPNKAWHSSLVWMRDNTPEPFGDPEFYYELYERPPAGERYAYPESAYGVMCWWDFGYWITRIAHRIPNASPGGQSQAKEAALFFTSQNESLANEMLDELGSRYVIVDYEVSTSEFGIIPQWAGEDRSDYLELYYSPLEEGGSGLKTYYYPEYYRSIMSRLYNFEGKAVVPDNSTMVISYEETTVLGTNMKKILSSQTFTTYEEAQAYLESQTASNYRIVGKSPFISPVPLAELEHYELKYQSEPEVVEAEEEPIPYVKIFQYLP